MTRTTGHSTHKFAARRCSASLYLDLLRGRQSCPGTDGVAGLVLPCPIAIQKVTVHQQRRADPAWFRIYSIWNPSMLHLQTRPRESGHPGTARCITSFSFKLTESNIALG